MGATVAFDARRTSPLVNFGDGGATFDAANTGATLLTGTGLYCPGIASNSMIFSNHPSLQITGDQEWVFHLAADDWTPPSAFAIASKWTDTSNDAGWIFFINTDGTLVAYWSTDGSTSANKSSTAALAFSNGVFGWLRIACDVSNGGNNLWKFYTHTDQDDTPALADWTQLGSTVTTAGATSFYANTAPLVLSGYNSGAASPAPVKFKRFILRSGIDGAATDVFAVDFTTGLVHGSERTVPVTVTNATLEGAQAISNLGTGGTVLDAIAGSSVVADTNDPVYLPHDGVDYAYMPGVAGNGITLADVALGTDQEWVFRVDCPVWPPAAEGAVVCKTYSQYGFTVTLSSNGRIYCYYSLDGAVQLNAYTDVLASAPEWVKITRNGTTGAILFRTATGDGTNTPPTFGAALTTAGTETAGALYNSTDLVTIGARDDTLASLPFLGKIYRVILKDGIGGSSLIDVNFDADGATGASTSFTATAGGTATVVRSAAGRKLAIVDRARWLPGTDDYLEVPSNELLNFGATDSFTVMAAARQWETAVSYGRYLNKRDTVTGCGYTVMTNATTLALRSDISDGSNTQNLIAGSTLTAGALASVGLVVDRSAQTMRTFSGATLSSTASTSAVGSLANSGTFRIGTATGEYQDCELFGAAVWRRALTAGEITTVNTAYTTGTFSAAAQALLEEAVFWIDAEQSTSKAAIARSTSGKKAVAVVQGVAVFGSDDYWEISDGADVDLDADDDGTFQMVLRQWATLTSSMTLASKRDNATGAGWTIKGQTASTVRITVTDGSDTVTSDVTIDLGVWQQVGFVIDRTNQLLIPVLNGVRQTGVDITAVGSMANAIPIRVGRLGGAGTDYGDFEFGGASFDRTALANTTLAAWFASLSGETTVTGSRSLSLTTPNTRTLVLA